MSELHTFLFEGLPVRGVLVRLTDTWTEILRRRGTGAASAYPMPVQNMLGEMVAALSLIRSNIKFDGSLLLQMVGDGPVQLAVAEVQADLGLRATATVTADIADDASLSSLVNTCNRGKCVLMRVPQSGRAGQQIYQGVVPLSGDAGEKFEKISDMLAHYMRQSEQLDTTLVLAVDERVAAGLLIQRVAPGMGNVASGRQSQTHEIDLNEHYQRIAMLASSLQRKELLSLDAETILRRLFWQEKLLRLEPGAGDPTPHFSCTCSRERVSKTILGLGAGAAQSIAAERGAIDVGCDFCGAQYRFDPIDVAQIFRGSSALPPVSSAVQ